MALLFIDSVATYNTAQLSRKWSSATGSGASVNAASSRTGGPALNLGNNGGVYQRTLPSAKQTLIVGCGCLPTGAFVTGVNAIISGIDSATSQWEVRMTAGGNLTFTRNGTVLATSTYVMSLNVGFYLEVKCKIDGSVGTYEVRVNGAAVIGPTTGANTKTSGNASADRVQFGQTLQGATGFFISDIYIADDSGSLNKDFLGDVKVKAVMPSANGTNTGLTTSTGTNHAALVNENPANDDTNYNESASVGNKDTYAMAGLSGSWLSVKGVQINMVAKKDDAGARSICSVTRSGGADYDGAAQGLSTSYVNYREVIETDPNTGAAWASSAAVDAAEFGMKVQA